ncbi:zinc-binding dehydrogenase [Streptacidiphilus griseoplanus]|uniref:zinc-binding dehydrogenase n=1 Tax=Peterkaempfera griseoplana TaxID=66896 RepID=UPI000A5EAC33|nr:zinc-binding dehydrogenase [Peterkaempfera griseoplana]
MATYQAFPKRIQEALLAAGATPVIERGIADAAGDFDDMAARWMETLWATLAEEYAADTSDDGAPRYQVQLLTEADVRPAIVSEQAYPLTVVANEELVGAASIIAVDPPPNARERTLAFGADLALDPAAPDFADQVRAATDGRGMDFAFDCAGVPAVREQAASVLGRGGSLILVGITPKPITITEGLTFNYMCKQVRGHYGGTPEGVDELVQLASRGRLDLAPSITDHIPLADAAAAVHRLENKIGDPIRLILVP